MHIFKATAKIERISLWFCVLSMICNGVANRLNYIDTNNQVHDNILLLVGALLLISGAFGFIIFIKMIDWFIDKWLPDKHVSGTFNK